MATDQSSSMSWASTYTGIGGIIHNYSWTWDGKPLTVVYETLGEGTPVLLLPAFSTVSTRGEMRGIARRLSPQFQVIALDWPGFGQSDRPPLEYQPDFYHKFLQDFTRDIVDGPMAVVAAGHAAGYAMHLAKQTPRSCSKLVLVAPTWRGPLTAMGSPQQISDVVRQVVRSPILGEALYHLNTTPSFLRFMYGRHVYVDEGRLTAEFIEQKYHITQHPGARYASSAFVTGAIDPVHSRDEFLAYVRPLNVPLMVIIGEQVPSQSREEMNALAQVSGVQSIVVPGSLGMHEENAQAVADVIQNFLGVAKKRQ